MQVSILVTLWVATALLYPSLRRVTAWFVDNDRAARPDYSNPASGDRAPRAGS